jgi:hypothetical protein
MGVNNREVLWIDECHLDAGLTGNRPVEVESCIEAAEAASHDHDSSLACGRFHPFSLVYYLSDRARHVVRRALDEVALHPVCLQLKAG